MNREYWLGEVSRGLEPLFKQSGFTIRQKYRVTCGWPARHAMNPRGRRVGECHSPTRSKDGTSEVFISPTLDDPLEVAGTLAHELIHVTVGTREGHSGKFKTACRYLGMVGKPQYAMPGERLQEQIQKIVTKIGEYPHKAILIPDFSPIKQKPKSTKLTCECGCVIRINPEHLQSYGSPVCGCGLPFSAGEE